jgi:hypothetical protein
MFHLFSYDPKSEQAIIKKLEHYDGILPKRIPQLSIKYFFKAIPLHRRFLKACDYHKNRHPTF